MTNEQAGLLRMADESLEAARILADKGISRFSVSRAYYCMFYCAEALLLIRGLSFSKHAGVIAAFGKQFVKAGLLPEILHRYLIEASELREDSDYDFASTIDASACAEQMERAGTFLAAARKFLEKHDA